MLEAGEGVRMELLAWGQYFWLEPHLLFDHPSPKQAAEIPTLMKAKSSFMCCAAIWRSASKAKGVPPEAGWDSFYFESATPHRWKNPGRKETWVLWINTPPTF